MSDEILWLLGKQEHVFFALLQISKNNVLKECLKNDDETISDGETSSFKILRRLRF